jgi:RNA polymerase sigma factor (sigma-70 family)
VQRNKPESQSAETHLEALSRLDTRFRRPLMSFFLRRVSNYAEAQDLTQQVFVRLMVAGDLGRIDHAGGYLFRIATNLLKDRQRRLRSTPFKFSLPDRGFLDELIEGAVEDRSPERVLLAKEALADVLGTLDGLGKKTLDIFILFRLENMKQRDIAEVFGISQSTVEKHVIKASFHLARKYGLSKLW